MISKTLCNWKKEPLGRLIRYMTKGIPPVYVDEMTNGTIRVLNQKCNRENSINYADSRLHDISKKPVPDKKMLCDNDILINSTGTGTAGRVAQIFSVPCPTTFDGHMILVRPNNRIDVRYLGYAMKMQQSAIEQLAEGSTGQTELNRQRLCTEIMVCFPDDLGEQKEISDLFYDIDMKITANAKINHHLPTTSVTGSSPDIKRGKKESRVV